jgi:hypothetical protein
MMKSQDIPREDGVSNILETETICKTIGTKPIFTCLPTEEDFFNDVDDDDDDADATGNDDDNNTKTKTNQKKQQTLWPLVSEQTIPTE